MRRLVTKAETEQMMALYERGLTVDEVGSEMGYSGSTVYYQLKKAGVKLRKSGLESKNILSEIKSAVEDEDLEAAWGRLMECQYLLNLAFEALEIAKRKSSRRSA